MAAEPGAIILEAPPGEWPLRLVWDPTSTPDRAPGSAGDGDRSPWRAEPELDWERAEALLLVSALFEDGRALALASVRPRGARGHDHDQVLYRLESSGGPVAVTEALPSTEYDADGHLRRIGVELWIDPSSPPLRVAADRRGEVDVEVDGNGVRREAVAMSFRLDGTSGAGACELLPAARLMAIRAVISDFGGVLTTPLLGSFTAVQDETGVTVESLGGAMQRIAERDGENPLHRLERGQITETDFLAAIGRELTPELGHEPELHRFSEIYFDALDPNLPMIELMRGLSARGYRMALLTNNIREWEPLWRRMLPVEEIFEVIVDSAFVGVRKPERDIYELTLERIGNGIGAPECLFVDDVEQNIAAARELGMATVHFRTNEEAIPEIEAALGTA